MWSTRYKNQQFDQEDDLKNSCNIAACRNIKTL